MAELNQIQSAAQHQFDRQSDRYGRDHILADVSDLQAILARLPSLSGRKALDIATGGGHTGLHLASQGWQVTFTDISAAMLERANATAKERGFTVEARQHPAESLPYADGTFDLVTCRVAPHHFSDPAAFVRETARVLKRGGAFVLIDGSIEDGQPEADAWLHEIEKLRDPSHVRLLTPNTWKRLCAEAGLQVVFAELSWLKQPNLNWYFDTAATSPENRAKVLDLIRNAPASARALFRLGEEDGKIVWWWQRVSLLAQKSEQGES
jgi:ubiquinone/menaquinone biosynthesis C-methylase UbiE